MSPSCLDVGLSRDHEMCELISCFMGIVRGGSGGDEGKMPIRDESLNNPTPIIFGFEEESPNNGIVVSILVLRSVVQKSNWSIVTIFPWCGKEMVRNTKDGTVFMA